MRRESGEQQAIFDGEVYRKGQDKFVKVVVQQLLDKSAREVVVTEKVSFLQPSGRVVRFSRKLKLSNHSQFAPEPRQLLDKAEATWRGFVLNAERTKRELTTPIYFDLGGSTNEFLSEFESSGPKGTGKSMTKHPDCAANKFSTCELEGSDKNCCWYPDTEIVVPLVSPKHGAIPCCFLTT